MMDFIASGMMGDFVHSLYVVKNICEAQNEKANLYLVDGHNGDIWRYGLEKAHADLQEAVQQQPYIAEFSVLKGDVPPNSINLNNWRLEAADTHNKKGRYEKSWSELLSQYYGFEIPKEYKWMDLPKDLLFEGKTIVHRSKHHHNGAVDFWGDFFSTPRPEKPFFVTCDPKEWEMFPHKNKCNVYFCTTVSQMMSAIGSCAYFVGNQSAPFAIACAFDVKRLCELDHDPAPFYMGETKYSNNIQWILDKKTKHL